MIELKVLNEKGISAFEEYIERLRTEISLDPPANLMSDDSMTEVFPGDVSVDDNLSFADKMEAGKYLYNLLGQVTTSYDVRTHRGLWAWLALCYFDQLCPKRGDGARHVGATPRYILPRTDSPEHWMRYYRHLLAGPFDIYRIHGANARLLLQSFPVSTMPEIFEQLASRMEIIASASLIEALDELYYDKNKHGPKAGVAGKDQPGTVRRFGTIVRQLDLTYDLYSLSGKSILRLLPSEFGRWMKS